MIKTRVPMPDHVYRDAKGLADENEMSLSGMVRRDLVEIERHHRPGRSQPSLWRLPDACGMGEPMAFQDKWTGRCRDGAMIARHEGRWLWGYSVASWVADTFVREEILGADGRKCLYARADRLDRSRGERRRAGGACRLDSRAAR